MTAEQLYISFADIDSSYLTESMDVSPKKSRFFWIKAACSAAALILVLTTCFRWIPLAQHGFCLSVQTSQFVLTTGRESEPLPPPHNMIGTYLWHGVNFDSVEEMRSDFLTYRFTKEEFEHIDTLLKDNGGKVAIPNLLNLCKLILPDDAAWSGGVSWSGHSSYSFDTSCSSMVRLCVSTSSKKSFEATRDHLLNYTAPDELDLIECRQVDDRNATLYLTQSKNGYIDGFLVYTLKDGDKVIYVKEYYSDGYSPSKLSDYISLYIQDNGYYCYVYMDGYETRPTVEWLLSFGMERCP